jgi:putative ABC transport system permease protein
MAWLASLRSALSALFRRRQEDRELAEEIRHHLDLETAYRVRQGASPAAARREAVRAFGGVSQLQEDVRDEWGAGRVESLVKDVSFAWRSLRREAGLTSLVVVTLGFGIGATTALFAVVKSALLAPLPYADPGTVAEVWSAWKGYDHTWLSYDEYEAWKVEIPAFKDIALYGGGSVDLTGGDQPERVRETDVDRNVFPVLGVTPRLGRNFTAEEDRPGGPSAAIISYDLWQRRFGGDPAVVGRSIEVNGVARPLVGVMPSGFRLPLDFGADGRTDIYLPLATDAANEGAVPGPAFPAGGGGSHSYFAVARLAPGSTVELANAQLRDLVAQLTRDKFRTATPDFRAFAVPVADQVSGNVRTPLLILLGAVAVVLLIACANVAGLLLVRGERRRRELAVRVALGADRGRITRLLFAESALLAVMGMAVGLGVARLGLEGVRRFAPSSLARVGDAHLDPWLLTAALAVAGITALLTGLLPALQASRVSPAEEMREGGRSATSGQARLRWRQGLVTAEVALAVVLAVGAGLLIRTVVNLVSLDPGFDTRGILTMRLSTPSMWYGDSLQVTAFWRNLEHDLTAVPGVKAVGSVRLLPLATEMGDWGIQVEGYTPPNGRGFTPGDWQILTPGAFAVLGFRLREGRLLGPADDMQGPLAMVVNESFAKAYAEGRSPLGLRVRIGSALGPKAPQYQIVGVVEDARHNTLTSQVKPTFYVTPAQFAMAPGSTRRSMSLVLRTTDDPKALIAPVRAVIRRADPRLPISEVRTMHEIVGASIAAPDFAMRLLTGFGFLALTLSAVGIFGVVAHSVAIRQQEFGIRAALGARPRELLGMALGSGLRQTAVGIGIGVVLALLATRLLGSVLQGVGTTDPVTFAVVVGVTALVTLGASLVPAVRAARAEPGMVLRTDQ